MTFIISSVIATLKPCEACNSCIFAYFSNHSACLTSGTIMSMNNLRYLLNSFIFVSTCQLISSERQLKHQRLPPTYSSQAGPSPQNNAICSELLIRFHTTHHSSSSTDHSSSSMKALAHSSHSLFSHFIFEGQNSHPVPATCNYFISLFQIALTAY